MQYCFPLVVYGYAQGIGICMALSSRKDNKSEKGGVSLQAKAMLNAVNALPQLEQADKLTARMPPAKWAADMHIAASESCKLPIHPPPSQLWTSSLPQFPFPFCLNLTTSMPFLSSLSHSLNPPGLSLTALPPQPPPQHPFLAPPPPCHQCTRCWECTAHVPLLSLASETQQPIICPLFRSFITSGTAHFCPKAFQHPLQCGCTNG